MIKKKGLVYTYVVFVQTWLVQMKKWYKYSEKNDLRNNKP